MEKSELDFQREDLKRFNIQIGNINDDFSQIEENSKPEKIFNIYDPEKERQKQVERKNKKVKREKVTDMNKSYESIGSNEDDEIHYNLDSDAEPPTDQVGDKISIVKKQQVVKTILEVGEKNSGKPGRPFIVYVYLLGYFARSEKIEAQIDENQIGSSTIKIKDVDEIHDRQPAYKVDERGEIFVDHYDLELNDQLKFFKESEKVFRKDCKPIQLTLGDDRIPQGLWKSIENMRKGERALIMIKPKWGYNQESTKDIVKFPRGWEEGEKKQALQTRRVFFEVRLCDWVIRHDINGDGLFIKTILQKGKGFETPCKNDQIKIDIKIYQGERIFFEKNDLESTLNNQKVIPLTIRTILESMKRNEKVKCIVQPAQFLHYDKDLRNDEKGGFPEIDEDNILYVDLELKSLQQITDLYRDETTFYQVLQNQESSSFSTASPFYDSIVELKLKLEIGQQTIFDNFLSQDNIKYDLEEYQLPAVLRRILKISKINQIVEVKSKKEKKLLDFLPDEQNKIFIKSILQNALQSQQEIKITFQIQEIIQKEHVTKIKLEEKLKRLTQLENISIQFYERYKQNKSEDFLEKYLKQNDLKKSQKLRLRIQKSQKRQEEASKFIDEDSQCLEFINTCESLFKLHLRNVIEICQILKEQNLFSEALQKVNEGLNKLNQDDYHLLMVKIQILELMNKYQEAFVIIENMLESKIFENQILELNDKKQYINQRIQEDRIKEIELSKKMLGIKDES